MTVILLLVLIGLSLQGLQCCHSQEKAKLKKKDVSRSGHGNSGGAAAAEYHVTQITGPLATGEGAHWDHERRRLYMVDIRSALVICYNPKNNATITAKVTGAKWVSIIIPVKGSKDKFIIDMDRSIAIIKWDSQSHVIPKRDIEIVVTVEKDMPSNRFDDGRTDPVGRLVTGTMCDISKFKRFQGALYSIDKQRKLRTLLHNVTLSNGMAWSNDNSTFYYNDSGTLAVQAFDYDVTTGNIKNRRVVFDLTQHGLFGIPDGMTIDRDDNLWIPVSGGGSVININPRTRRLIRKIDFPFPFVRSVAFMGDDLDQLVVTSGYINFFNGERVHDKDGQIAGVTYLVTGLGVSGMSGRPVVM